MKQFIFLISDYTHNYITLGSCDSIPKMLNTFDMLNSMSLHWPKENYLNRLVYFEECTDEFMTEGRMKMLYSLTTQERREMITDINPKWEDLTKDLNFMAAVL